MGRSPPKADPLLAEKDKSNGSPIAVEDDKIAHVIDISNGGTRLVGMAVSKKGKSKSSDIHAEIRGLGVLIEKVDHDVSVIAEQYGDINKKLDSHSTKIESINAKLDSHSTKIDSINAKLDSHSTKIESINAKLDSHSEMIGGLAVDIEIVKTDVAFIKNSLKQKVGIEEFSALERRVAFLEKRK